MVDSFDKRITPARADLAAAHLKGKVEAPRYVEGEKRSICIGRASLHTEADFGSMQATELLYGEIFTVYDQQGDWIWGQAESDLYVGYLFYMNAGPVFSTDATVSALMAPVFSEADLKKPLYDKLPLNSRVKTMGVDGVYVNMGYGFVHQRHLAPQTQKDFVTVAQRFLGVPYVWGGKTQAGLDCSGLVQTALQAVGKAAPRDTDMMEKALGDPVALSDVRRGDIIFWKGHVGVMLDAQSLLHANAFHMEVAIEPLAEAMERIEKVAGPVTSVKRL